MSAITNYWTLPAGPGCLAPVLVVCSWPAAAWAGAGGPGVLVELGTVLVLKKISFFQFGRGWGSQIPAPLAGPRTPDILFYEFSPGDKTSPCTPHLNFPHFSSVTKGGLLWLFHYLLTVKNQKVLAALM